MPEFRIMKVWPWSKEPHYQVLINGRPGKGWFALRLSNGAPATFFAPPKSLKEAQAEIKAYDESHR